MRRPHSGGGSRLTPSHCANFRRQCWCRMRSPRSTNSDRRRPLLRQFSRSCNVTSHKTDGDRNTRSNDELQSRYPMSEAPRARMTRLRKCPVKGRQTEHQNPASATLKPMERCVIHLRPKSGGRPEVWSQSQSFSEGNPTPGLSCKLGRHAAPCNTLTPAGHY